MSVVSLAFPAFCILLFFVYFLMPAKCRPFVLAAASLAYVASFGWQGLLVFLLTVAVAFLAALWIEQPQHEAKREDLSAEEKKARKAAVKRKSRTRLTIAVILILGTLVILKYGNFLTENINLLLHGDVLPARRLLMPLGISFYTLQLCGYLLDVYHGKCKADRNPLRFFLFAGWFPQLLQGPIHRYSFLAEQLTEGHSFDWERMKRGVLRMLWGYFKKLVIADRIALFVTPVLKAGSGYQGMLIWLGILCYGVEIYADFSGGMDIVSGLSEVLGIRLAENFRRPYLAKSVDEFWRRWHITLGGWMKEHLFYPLALSKASGRLGRRLRTKGHATAAKTLPVSLATLITFLCVGVWHGANWKYFVYGAYQAVFLSSASLLEPFYSKVRKRFGLTGKFIDVLRIVRTYLIISVGRFFSQAESLPAAFGLLAAGFKGTDFPGLFGTLAADFMPSPWDWFVLAIGVLMLVTADLLAERGVAILDVLEKKNRFIRWAVYIVGLMIVLIFGLYGRGFSSSNFIYAQF